MPHLPVCSTDVIRSVVYQAAPALDEITMRVGRLGGVLYRMGEGGLDHLAGCARPFRAQSRKLDRNPCGTAGMPSSLSNFDGVMLESGFPRRLRNTRPVPSLNLCTSCRIVKDALLRAADIAGIRALLVHAKDGGARGWYEAREFEPSPTDHYHLFLLMKDLRAMLSE